MIIAHLTYDTRSLLACSLTCYSWYIAAVLHLHRTLITSVRPWNQGSIFEWHEPLLHMHKFGLLPLVKEFQAHMSVSADTDGFSPKLFNRSILRQFSALTNVQELGIDYLVIHKFMPDIRRYFGHFLPTVRSLALRTPRGSRRQTLCFIGLFPHLDDLKIYSLFNFQEGPTSDLTLVPPFAPPLRGRLILRNCGSEGFFRDMIDLLGGIQFRYMDLCLVDEKRLLLDACAETLETLRLYPTDACCKKASPDDTQVPADNPPVGFPPGGIDLSRNKSLRALEVTASSILGGKPNFLTHALSTITSPVFSEVIIFYRDYNFYGVGNQTLWYLFPRVPWPMSEGEVEEQVLRHHMQFELFHKMHRIRGFRVVLCADVWYRVVKYTVGVLKRVIAVEKVKEGFDGHFSEPLVVYTPRRSPPEFSELVSADSPLTWTSL